MALLKQCELVLVIGPCGAGKTIYARMRYPQHVQPDREAMIRVLHPWGQLVYYPALRRAAAQMQRVAVESLMASGVAICLTVGGATQRERALWIALAQAHDYPVAVVRLCVDAATAIARARADTSRPATSRSAWRAIVDRWFRDFESIDALAEGITRYEEISNA